MNGIKEWQLAFRNLSRNLRRTITTALALIVGFVGISLLTGQIYNTERTIRTLIVYMNHLGHFTIYKKDGVERLSRQQEKYQIPEGEVAKVDEVLKQIGPDIEFTAKFVTAASLLSTGQVSTPVIVRGINPDLDEYVKNHLEVKTWLPELISGDSGKNLKDFTNKYSDPISVSTGVSELLGKFQKLDEMPATEKEMSLASRTLAGDLNAVSTTLAAKHTTGIPYFEDFSVIAPISMVQELLDSKGLDRFGVYLKNPSEISEKVDWLRGEFKKLNLDVEVLPYNNPRVGFYYVGAVSFLVILCIFFTFLVFGASSLIIVNSMTMSVLERTKEIGTLRSLGFTPKKVRSLFAKESVCLAFISSIIGILLSEVISRTINSLNILYESPGMNGLVQFRIVIPWPFHIAFTLVLVGLAMATSVFVTRKKTKEGISSLLTDAGASA